MGRTRRRPRRRDAKLALRRLPRGRWTLFLLIERPPALTNSSKVVPSARCAHKERGNEVQRWQTSFAQGLAYAGQSLDYKQVSRVVGFAFAVWQSRLVIWCYVRAPRPSATNGASRLGQECPWGTVLYREWREPLPLPGLPLWWHPTGCSLNFVQKRKKP